MKNIVYCLNMLLLLTSCVGEQNNLINPNITEPSNHASDAKKYRIYPAQAPDDSIPPTPDAVYTSKGFYLVPIPKRGEECTYYKIHSSGVLSTMRLYFLHSDGGFSTNSKDCI